MRVSDDFPVLHARSLHVVQETAPSPLIAHAADQAAFWTRATLAALVLSKLQFPSRAAQHGIAHARFPWAFTLGHYPPGDVAVGDHTDWFQVLFVFDYSDLAAAMPRHHLSCFHHTVLRRAASEIGDHNVFALFQEIANPFLTSSNINSHFEPLWRVTINAISILSPMRCYSGRVWYGELNAVSYAKFYSRSD